MKIHLIEDEEFKQNMVVALIDSLKLPIKCYISKSYNSACNNLTLERWDLMIVDMQLFTFEKNATERGGRKRPFGGLEIIQRSTRYNLNIPYVIVSQYNSFSESHLLKTAEDIHNDLKLTSDSNYKGFCSFGTPDFTWQNPLKTIILEIYNEDINS